MKRFLLSVLTGSMALALVPAVSAQTGNPIAGASVLIFPYIDNRPGKESLLSITNTNIDRSRRTGNLLTGDIQVHLIFFDENCREADRFVFLTPGDTFSELASELDPDSERGWMIAFAIDPSTGRRTDFDHLVGMSTVADMTEGCMWEAPAIGFQSNVGEFNPTDMNGNGRADFDGVEYTKFPDKLALQSFYEQGPPLDVDTHLILLNPTGAATNVSFLIYNNDEEPFSRGFQFDCWVDTRIVDVSRVTENLGGNPEEQPVGWMRIDSSQPILGAFVQKAGSSPRAFEGGTLLGWIGEMSVSLDF